MKTLTCVSGKRSFITCLRSVLYMLMLLLSGWVGLSSVVAQPGDLMVTPRRVVFEGAKRNDVLTLLNSGTDSATYAISFQHYKMMEDGSLKELPDSLVPDGYADKFLRFFPKQITLAPKGSQTVRLQLLKPQDLASGEYRTHIYFRAIDRAKPLEFVKSDTSSAISLNLHAIFGISIPIIVRQNTKPSTATIEHLKIERNELGKDAVFSADLMRSGDESIYGTLVLKFIPNGGSEMDLALLKGVAVYVPNPVRKVKIAAHIPPDLKLSQGVLKLEYQTQSDTGKESVLAETQLALN